MDTGHPYTSKFLRDQSLGGLFCCSRFAISWTTLQGFPSMDKGHTYSDKSPNDQSLGGLFMTLVSVLYDHSNHRGLCPHRPLFPLPYFLQETTTILPNFPTLFQHSFQINFQLRKLVFVNETRRTPNSEPRTTFTPSIHQLNNSPIRQ